MKSESESESHSVMSNSSLGPPWTIQSMEFSRPEYSFRPHGILQEWYPSPSPRDLPNPGIEPKSPGLLADSLPAGPQGKLKNTGVGSLSVLQGIFPTQESNRGLLHFRRILYQLSYEGSPFNRLPESYSIRQSFGHSNIYNLI